jgi:hypothetical protein
MPPATAWENRDSIPVGAKKEALRCVVDHALRFRTEAVNGSYTEADDAQGVIDEITEFAQKHGLHMTDSVISDLIQGITEIRDGWLESQSHWNPSSADC